MKKVDVFRDLYNPHTDLRTILNPPLVNWHEQWDSLGHRTTRAQTWAQREAQRLHQPDLQSTVVEDLKRNQAAASQLALVQKMHDQTPPFARAQLDHVNALMGQMDRYRLHLRRIFAFDFTHKLTQSRRYSPSHVNRTLLRHVTTDLRIAELAIQQRLPTDDRLMWDSHMLYLSDLMAYEALEPLKKAGIVPQKTAILTYMQRQTDVRMVPYYNAVLLGFPSSVSNRAASPPDEFLAIPHEIGHYLYRYGALDRIPREPKALIAKLANALGWSATVQTKLTENQTLLTKLCSIVPSRPVPCMEMPAKVQEICVAIQAALDGGVQSSASHNPATAAKQNALALNSQQVQNVIWSSLRELLRGVMEHQPEFITTPADQRDRNHEIAQALHKTLRKICLEGEKLGQTEVRGAALAQLLDNQDPAERTAEVQALRSVLNMRLEDIHTTFRLLLESMPAMSPDRSWVQQLYHGLLTYQQMPKNSDGLLQLTEEEQHPRLVAADARRILTPCIHEILAEKLHQLHILPTDWRRHWLEEIFCDAYGCLVAGPINALGFQILLSDEQYENDHLTRGKHPTSTLRPFLLSEILREMDRRGVATYDRIPDLLDLHWQHHLRQYGTHDQRYDILETLFTPEGQTPALTGEQIIAALQIVIDQIFDLFADLFAANPGNHDTAPAQNSVSAQKNENHRSEKQFQVPWQIWTQDVNIHAGQTPDQRILAGVMRQLQEQFAGYYTDNHEQRLAIRPPSVDASATAAMKRAQALADLLDTDIYTSDHRMPVADWVSVFAVNGWSTEGPRASNDQ